MIWRWRVTAVLLLVSAVPLLAQRPWPDAEVQRATLSFDGKSTLGDFTGVTTTVRGSMTGGSSLADVKGWVEAPVATLKTSNARRDRDLVKTMEAAIFPNIRFELSSVVAEWERGDSASVVLDGRFVIHGVSRAEKVRAIVVRSAAGVQLRADLPLNLHDYKVDNLKRLLVLRMQPDIVVHIDISF